jgi:hypothetical protein
MGKLPFYGKCKASVLMELISYFYEKEELVNVWYHFKGVNL